MSAPGYLKCYKYDFSMKVSKWMRVLISAALAVFGLLFIFGAFYVQAIREKQFSLFLTSFSVIYAGFSVVGFIIAFNLTPDICVDKDYLYINFFFKQKKVKLNNIIKVKRVVVPTRKQSFVVLFKDGLTPFHRIYGWIYGRSFYPGVYVGASISDRDELERLLMRYSQ
jgi:hypothetical protein